LGKYKGYSGGNHHLRTDMDHERRLIHDAKDDIYKEDRDLRDRTSAAQQTNTKDVDVLRGDALEQADHEPEEDFNSTK